MLLSFSLVLVLSVSLIGGLVFFAARSQEKMSIDHSVHLTRTVLSAIQSRLSDQLLDYSYWDQAVNNLVTTPDLEWADSNIGLYMHEKFGIASSFVIGDQGRLVYAMVAGRRIEADPRRRFSGGFEKLAARALAQSRSEPPVPVVGYLTAGPTVHVVAVSVLTNFRSEVEASAPIGTGSILVFTKAIDDDLLRELSQGYRLSGLRLGKGAPEIGSASLPITAVDGSRLAILSWRVESPAEDMLRWLLPLVGIVFIVFAATAYTFLRKSQSVMTKMARDIVAIQSAQEALKVSEERSRIFAADVAHELRTPLAVMRSQLDEIDDPQSITLLYEDVDHMSRLVSQLLAATRLDWVALKPGDKAELRSVCAEVAGLLAPIAIRDDKSIEVTGVDHPVVIHGNSDALEQAVRNLVENGLKYSVPGSVVTIEVTDQPSIRVLDRGPGIPPDKKEEVFLRFRRFETEAGGAGLGLSIVRRTADIHGATVDLEERPGGGTIFSIRFAPKSRIATPANGWPTEVRATG